MIICENYHRESVYQYYFIQNQFQIDWKMFKLLLKIKNFESFGENSTNSQELQYLLTSRGNISNRNGERNFEIARAVLEISIWTDLRDFVETSGRLRVLSGAN